MKKIATIILSVVVIMFMFAGCGNEGDTKKQSDVTAEPTSTTSVKETGGESLSPEKIRSMAVVYDYSTPMNDFVNGNIGNIVSYYGIASDIQTTNNQTIFKLTPEDNESNFAYISIEDKVLNGKELTEGAYYMVYGTAMGNTVPNGKTAPYIRCEIIQKY